MVVVGMPGQRRKLAIHFGQAFRHLERLTRAMPAGSYAVTVSIMRACPLHTSAPVTAASERPHLLRGGLYMN